MLLKIPAHYQCVINEVTHTDITFTRTLPMFFLIQHYPSSLCNISSNEEFTGNKMYDILT